MFGRIRRRSLLLAALAASLGSTTGSARSSSGRRPIILDTDIGDDIDDTWALIMLLRDPCVDLKLVVGDYGNPIYRARLTARLLESLGRSDVPIGIGKVIEDGKIDEPGQQSAWVGSYALPSYRGRTYEDGVGAIIDFIHASPEPVTLLCLGPVPNIAEALRRDSSITDNAHFVGMHGSIHKGYQGDDSPAAEYNVRVDPASLQQVFEAPWDCSITPLDTCGEIVLAGESYKRLYESSAPWLRTLMENYRAWLPGAPFISPDHDISKQSTTLFDAVAVHLALGGDLVNLEPLPLRVTDEGYTVIDHEHGTMVNCAMTWKDRSAFEAELIAGLLSA